ncbi:MAG TPA: EAL domain-containing protein [Devosia sp.]|nr:EAL domain-containing protein [Devosia sp.]
MSVSAYTAIANLVAPLDGLIDRLIGAGDLGGHVRNKLLRQQLRSIGQMTPALLVGSLVVSVVFLALTWGTARFLPLLTCLAAIEAIYLCATIMARTSPNPAALGVPAGAVVKTLCFAMALGGLWGATLNILPVGDSALVRSAATIGVGGLMCVSMMALVNYPQAFIAFIIPLLVGVGLSVAGLHSTPDLWVQGPLLSAFSAIMVLIAFRHARLFVDHRVSESLVQEKREIIGLLLREFEQSTSDWIWGFDENGRINRLSGGFTTATGVGEDALLGADFVHFLRCITPPNDPLMAQVEFDVAGKQTFQDVELRVTAGGQECWWNLTGKPAFDDSGMYLGYIGTGSDVSERKIAERRITKLAHHDPMTGLLNRTKFTEQLNQSVARLERYGTPFSVLFLDLDQFKSVNDTRGHMTGDKLLMMVAKRVEGLVRETDFVARLGGDEFAIIVPNDAMAEHVSGLAARLLEEIKQPYEIDDDVVTIGVSIGIAMAPINGTRPDQILRNADLALYRAKADGRSVFRFFENQMDSEARERRLLEVELRDALKNQELVLYYQPLVSAMDSQPTGFEALIRWNHPIRGLVPPAEFIPIAEQSNLIVDIGDWTIEQACMAAANWPDHLTVAVNLSAKHFRRSDISIVVKKALSMSGIAPARLEIEITEGLLMENPDDVTAKLAEIRALGVTIAMDDFGTGYSSLSYLLKFPFDKIKIDRSFVEASTTDAVARDILKAIASLGKTLKLKITAEGVETKEQADFLSEIACHQLQGFYFARPLDSIDMPHYLLTSVQTRAPLVKAEAEAMLAALAG